MDAEMRRRAWSVAHTVNLGGWRKTPVTIAQLLGEEEADEVSEERQKQEDMRAAALLDMMTATSEEERRAAIERNKERFNAEMRRRIQEAERAED